MSANTYVVLAMTGATGFVGSHLLDMAKSRGQFAKALTRSWQPPQDDMEWVEGMLDRPETLAKLVEDADAVIHVAGMINGPDRAAFDRVNAGGTAALVDAARAAGVRRFIHISSLSAREPDLSDYGWSKAKSERIVAASGLDWTIIRPPAIYGPGDRETFELFKMANKGLVALPPGGRFSVIHVADLCRLILAVLDHDDSHTAILEPDDGTPDGWDHRDFAQALGEALGRRKTRTMALSEGILGSVSRLDRLFRRGKAKLTPDRVRMYSHPDWVSAPARVPDPKLWRAEIETREGLKTTAEWYREQGWLR